MPNQRPLTIHDFHQLKAEGQPIVVVTAYDHPTARLADEAGVDGILVGDTLGMVVLGYDSTLPVTMADMLHHVRAVCRARPRALVIADMPFLACHVGVDEAVRNAGEFLRAGAGAVKVEGGRAVIPTVRRILDAGIPVMGHLGLQPQSVRQVGGFKMQARTSDAARLLRVEAQELEDAGVFALVLEMVPVEVAAAVSRELSVPTIGIGAGPGCDGQVQVIHDLLGLYAAFQPRHARRYAEAGDQIRTALASYAADVRARAFPGPAESSSVPELEDSSTWS